MPWQFLGLFLNYTVATGAGFSSTSFTTSLLLSTTLDLNRSLLKKSGLSKVVNFLGIGRRRPDFLKRIRTTTITMTIAIRTSPTVKTTWPWVGGSTLGLTVQIQNVDDEREEIHFIHHRRKRVLRDIAYQLLLALVVILEGNKHDEKTSQWVYHFCILLSTLCSKYQNQFLNIYLILEVMTLFLLYIYIIVQTLL